MDMRASLRFIMRVWSRWMRAEAHAVMGRLPSDVGVGCMCGKMDVVDRDIRQYPTQARRTHLTTMKASPASAEGPRTWKMR